MLQKLQDWLSPGPKRPYELFQIEPTLECDLECVMCPWTELRERAGTMDWGTFEHIAGYLPMAREVDLTGGGEPLMAPRLPEMVQAAKEAGCRAGFSTNGFGLNPQLSEALISLRLDWISFSVDAATAQSYEGIRRGSEFETVVENIAALRDLKATQGSGLPRMMMVFVMMVGGEDGATENYHQLPQYIELAHSLGIEQVIAKNLDVILKDGDDERRLFKHDGEPQPEVERALAKSRERARELGLGLRHYALHPEEQAICEHNPIRNLFFNWRGEVSPCITLAYAGTRIFNGERVHVPCQRYGNINQQDLDEIWAKPDYRAFRRIYKERLSAQRHKMMDSFLGSESVQASAMPPAPEGCRTCYYLYGI